MNYINPQQFPSLRKPFYRSIFTLLAIVCLSSTLFAQEIDSTINAYFLKVLNTFSSISSTPIVRGPKIKPVDQHFISILKKHQVIYSLIRTNSKGVIINEVTRAESPSRSYRNVEKQPWFQSVSKKMKSYYGFVKDKNGRYYLFWSDPMIQESSKGQKFLGAVAVKIDLWDSFHSISSNAESPYLVRLGGKSLYSHKWKKAITGFAEKSLTVPGVKNISVRYIPYGAPEVVQTSTSTETKETFEVAEAVTEEDVVSPKRSKKKFIFMGIPVFLLLGAIVFGTISWFKNWMLMRKIDKDERW